MPNMVSRQTNEEMRDRGSCPERKKLTLGWHRRRGRNVEVLKHAALLKGRRQVSSSSAHEHAARIKGRRHKGMQQGAAQEEREEIHWKAGKSSIVGGL